MNEREELDRWKALQRELGLEPSDERRPEPERQAPPPGAEIRAESTHGARPEHDRGNLIRHAHGAAELPSSAQQHMPDTLAEEAVFGAGIELELGDMPEQVSEDNVEVGEAPEEVPDPEGEPALEGDKRRRRRRRRRGRRGRNEGGADQESIAGGPESTASGSPPEDVAEDEDADEDSDADEDNDDEDEVEPLSFTDWSVPTWNELIASLYRPER